MSESYRQTRNYENLNRCIYPGVGEFGIPELEPVHCDAETWIGFNYAKGCDVEDRPAHSVHFFIDDYQFNRLWTAPDVYLPMLSGFRCVATPDFSMYTDFPKAIQIYNHYRKHWLGRYWQDHGITVIPTIAWSTPDSYEWCFDGEPVGGDVIVSSVGTQADPECAELFMSGGVSVGAAGGGGGLNGPAAQFQVQTNPPNIVPTAQQAAQLNSSVFADTDTQTYHQLFNGKQYFQNQNLNIDQQIATINYLADQPEPGSLYSPSQNMNWNMANGQKLTANQQYMQQHMMAAMHNLGYNLNLTRYDHPQFVNGLLQQAGVKNADYTKLSPAALKKALTGMSYGENKFLSTSYNDFKNAPASSQSVFNTRAVKISYQAKANVQAMMPGNGPGGSLGEVVLAPSGGNKNMKIVDVRYTGNSARQQGSRNMNLPQIEIVVEVSKQ